MDAPDSWEDADAGIGALTLDEEEDAFVPPVEREWRALDPAAPSAEPPALLVDLSALSREGGEPDVARVRGKVLESLNADFSGRAGELLVGGVCWHVPRDRGAEERAAHEGERPGAVLTVIEYPAEIEGISVEQLWGTITRETPWEIVDEIKRHVAATARSLKFQADLCIEIEQLAAQEAQVADRAVEARQKVEALQHDRSNLLGRMHASHERSLGTQLDPEQVSAMLREIDEMDEMLGAATAEAAEAAELMLAEGEGGAAAEGERSMLDLVLDLVFERYPPSPAYTRTGGSWAEHETLTAEARRRLRTMWEGWFGRLPAASKLALKHAPPAPIKLPVPPTGAPAARGPDGRPRMKVPGPPRC